MTEAEAPTSDREMAVWAAGVSGLIASLAVLVYGITEGDVIVVAALIGAIWSAFTMVTSFLRSNLGDKGAIAHAALGVALIISIGLSTGGWRLIAVILVLWLVACGAAYIGDHRDQVRGRLERLRGRSP